MYYRDEENKKVRDCLTNGGVALLRSKNKRVSWLAQTQKTIDRNGSLQTEFVIMDKDNKQQAISNYPIDELDVFFDHMWSICDVDEWELIEPDRGVDSDTIINVQSKQLTKAKNNADGYIKSHRFDQAKIAKQRQEIKELKAAIAEKNFIISEQDKTIESQRKNLEAYYTKTKEQESDIAGLLKRILNLRLSLQSMCIMATKYVNTLYNLSNTDGQWEELHKQNTILKKAVAVLKDKHNDR